jgi:suppressor for copper-sensitivity B
VSRGETEAVAEAGPWRPFEPAAIADEVRLGRVVVVDVTADWCLTCKVNKQAVLDRGPVRDRLARPDVTAMLADWTRPDPAIARYLARYGRYGIPFTAVYGPATPEGQVLPELLTDSAVLDAIRKAGGGA